MYFSIGTEETIKALEEKIKENLEKGNIIRAAILTNALARLMSASAQNKLIGG